MISTTSINTIHDISSITNTKMDQNNGNNVNDTSNHYRILSFYRFVRTTTEVVATEAASKVTAMIAVETSEATTKTIMQTRKMIPTTTTSTMIPVSTSTTSTIPPTQNEGEQEQLRILQNEINRTLSSYNAKGTILLAAEGINGTICYPYSSAANDDDINNSNNNNNKEKNDPVLRYLQNHPIFGCVPTSQSPSSSSSATKTLLRTNIGISNDGNVFQRLKVRIKDEIVTMGIKVDNNKVAVIDKKKGNEEVVVVQEPSLPSSSPPPLVNPQKRTGNYIKPNKDWDDILNDPYTLVIDTRNKYETSMGKFNNAIDPRLDNFKQFPKWFDLLIGALYYGEDIHQDCEENDENDEKEEEVKDNKGSNDVCSIGMPLLEQHDPRSTKIIRPTQKLIQKLRSRTQTVDTTTKTSPPLRIAMYCTGGIRCEKSTSYALYNSVSSFPSSGISIRGSGSNSDNRGVSDNVGSNCGSGGDRCGAGATNSSRLPSEVEVCHLEGGILSYLAKKQECSNGYKNNENKVNFSENKQNDNKIDDDDEEEHRWGMWRGECFVFDRRVSVCGGESQQLQSHQKSQQSLLLQEEQQQKPQQQSPSSTTKKKTDNNNMNKICINDSSNIINSKKRYRICASCRRTVDVKAAVTTSTASASTSTASASTAAVVGGKMMNNIVNIVGKITCSICLNNDNGNNDSMKRLERSDGGGSGRKS